MTEDWIYSPQRMALREKVLSILLYMYGRDPIPENNEQIYACAHDWVSQGHPTASGVVQYYRAYYEPEEDKQRLSDS